MRINRRRTFYVKYRGYDLVLEIPSRDQNGKTGIAFKFKNDLERIRLYLTNDRINHPNDKDGWPPIKLCVNNLLDIEEGLITREEAYKRLEGW